MFASQFLEVLSPTGRRYGTATGFFMRNSSGTVFLVTNRHVVTGRHWETNKLDGHVAPSALRFTVPVSVPSGAAGFWTQIAIGLGDADDLPVWLEHPTHGRRVDVVAIPISETTQDAFGRDLDFVTYASGASPARLGIANDVYTIGFPVGVDPVNHAAFPLWIRGSVAWPPRLDWHDLPAFVIDSRTRQGQSGSPVVIYADETMACVTPANERAFGPAWGLVGVYSGRIHSDSDIGIVWKRSALDEIVEHGARSTDLTVPPLQISLLDAADADNCPPPAVGCNEA
jgi:hypothetical protein